MTDKLRSTLTALLTDQVMCKAADAYVYAAANHCAKDATREEALKAAAQAMRSALLASLPPEEETPQAFDLTKVADILDRLVYCSRANTSGYEVIEPCICSEPHELDRASLMASILRQFAPAPPTRETD